MSVRTTIRLRRDLRDRAMRRASERKISFARLIEEALIEHLAKPRRRSTRPTALLPAFGDPKKRLKWDELAAKVDAEAVADDLKRLSSVKPRRHAAA